MSPETFTFAGYDESRFALVLGALYFLPIPVIWWKFKRLSCFFVVPCLMCLLTAVLHFPGLYFHPSVLVGVFLGIGIDAFRLFRFQWKSNMIPRKHLTWLAVFVFPVILGGGIIGPVLQIQMVFDYPTRIRLTENSLTKGGLSAEDFTEDRSKVTVNWRINPKYQSGYWSIDDGTSHESEYGYNILIDASGNKHFGPAISTDEIYIDSSGKLYHGADLAYLIANWARQGRTN